MSIFQTDIDSVLARLIAIMGISAAIIGHYLWYRGCHLKRIGPNGFFVLNKKERPVQDRIGHKWLQVSVGVRLAAAAICFLLCLVLGFLGFIGTGYAGLTVFAVLVLFVVVDISPFSHAWTSTKEKQSKAAN